MNDASSEAPQDAEMNDNLDTNLRLLEAMLFASAIPVSEKSLGNRLPEGTDVAALLQELSAHYAGRGVHLRNVGDSWAFRTASDIKPMLEREIEVARKLGRATIETLAIIAYHQPITRAEIEEIRGVGLSKGTLDALFEQGWVRPRGRRKTPGRPTTWGTTDAFLDHFGLESIKDLPGMDELKAAGLLDKRPAIDAYRISGRVAASSAEAVDGNGCEDGEVVSLTSYDEGMDEENEGFEPLDPNGES